MRTKPSVDLSSAANIVKKAGKGRDTCIGILQELQATYGFLPVEVLRYVTDNTRISMRQIYGVATFYDQFRFTPVGRHMIRVCHGTACHVNGAERISQAVENVLKIKNHETTDDGLFTLESVACLGCCSLAPVMMVDNTVYGRLTPGEARKIIKTYQKKDYS